MATTLTSPHLVEPTSFRPLAFLRLLFSTWIEAREMHADMVVNGYLSKRTDAELAAMGLTRADMKAITKQAFASQ
jgi:hypothetical protein